MSLFRRLFGRGGDAPRDEAEAAVEASQLATATERTRRGFFSQIASLFGVSQISNELWDDLEALLVQADVGIPTATYLVARTKAQVKRAGVVDPQEVRAILHAEMVQVLQDQVRPEDDTAHPYVILVVGVNGAGKTTLIAKLAHRYLAHGKKVLLAAGDTFRAAATEQLETWAERVGVPVITRGQGADPGAVVYDAGEAAITSDCDVLIIDTPPLKPISDAYEIAALCNYVIYVVRHDCTPKSNISMIEEEFVAHQINNVGIVFNGIKKRGQGRFSYGYGYGYGFDDRVQYEQYGKTTKKTTV
jgi:Mrp family chromosome partitioning ATPase